MTPKHNANKWFLRHFPRLNMYQDSVTVYHHSGIETADKGSCLRRLGETLLKQGSPPDPLPKTFIRRQRIVVEWAWKPP